MLLGMNNYCSSQTASTAYKCPSGFQAGPGWDPTTGWGSIDLPALGNMTGFAVSGLPASSSNGKGQLSTGAIAGIVVGVLVVVISIMVFVVNKMCSKPQPTTMLANHLQPQQQQGGVGAPTVSSMNPVYATNVVVAGRPVQQPGLTIVGKR